MFPRCALISVISPAHSGVAALVPPLGSALPSTTSRYGDVSQSALAATSGMHLPVIAPAFTESIFKLDCQVGRGNTALTPPPVLPPLSDRNPSPSFHTISFFVLPLVVIVVPPTDKTNGLDPGKST